MVVGGDSNSKLNILHRVVNVSLINMFHFIVVFKFNNELEIDTESPKFLRTSNYIVLFE